MKIGLFTDTYYPQINGVATSVLMLKKNLEMRGHEVYVFTTTDPEVVESEINVYRVPSLPFVSKRRVGMLYNQTLAKFIKGLNLDVIHTHTEFSLGIFGRKIARDLHIPLLHTYHTIYEDYTHYIAKMKKLDPIAKTVARKMSANFCNSVDEVIAPTEKVKNLLLSYNINKNISIIPTGIELNKFSKYNYNSKEIQDLRSSLGIGIKDKVMLYIGRISEEKNIEEILTSIKSYFKGKDDVKFVLIGDGPHRRNLEIMVKELDINEKVIFAGERPWEEIGMYYQIGDVFVSASQSETQGLTYLEALASGLPVLAKADLCLKGVLENNINGYAFHEKEDFLHALDNILYNELEKESLSIEAIKSTEKFSASHFASEIEKLYLNEVTIQYAERKVALS